MKIDRLKRRVTTLEQGVRDTHYIHLGNLTPQEMIDRYKAEMPPERRQAIATEKQERAARRKQAAVTFLARRERELNELNASDTQ